MDKRQISALLVLKEIGVSTAMDTFADRLIVQKSTYLAQECGVHLGYYFNWYIRGPYAPALAHDLFAAIEDPSFQSISQKWSVDSTTKETLINLRDMFSPPDQFNENAIRPKLNKSSWMELLASTHFLMTRRQMDNANPDAISTRLARYDKHYSAAQVQLALDSLREHQLLDA